VIDKLTDKKDSEPEIDVFGCFISINDHYDSLTADLSEASLTMQIKNLINDSYSRDISVKAH